MTTIDYVRSIVQDPTKSVVVLTGAGISTAAGIPDYRGPQGVWTKNPELEAQANIDQFRSSADTRAWWWHQVGSHLTSEVAYTRAHDVIASATARGLVRSVITTNVDGLHAAAGQPSLIELHGNLLGPPVCLDCGTGAVLSSSPAPGVDFKCTRCGGLLKPGVVMFGEALDDGLMDRAQRQAESCDYFIAIGTSLKVAPVSYLAAYADNLVIINQGDTAFDHAPNLEALINLPIEQAVPYIFEVSP